MRCYHLPIWLLPYHHRIRASSHAKWYTNPESVRELNNYYHKYTTLSRLLFGYLPYNNAPSYDTTIESYQFLNSPLSQFNITEGNLWAGPGFIFGFNHQGFLNLHTCYALIIDDKLILSKKLRGTKLYQSIRRQARKFDLAVEVKEHFEFFADL